MCVFTDGRGLALQQMVPPATSLLRLAPAALLHARSARIWLDARLLPAPAQPAHPANHLTVPPVLRPDDAPQLPLSSHQALALLLAMWRCSSGADSDTAASGEAFNLDAFLRTTPRSYDTVPLSWTLGDATSFADELLAALSPHVRTQCAAVQARFERDWAAVDHARVSRMCQVCSDVLTGSQRHSPHLLQPRVPLAPTSIADPATFSRADYLWGWLSGAYVRSGSLDSR